MSAAPLKQARCLAHYLLICGRELGDRVNTLELMVSRVDPQTPARQTEIKGDWSSRSCCLPVAADCGHKVPEGIPSHSLYILLALAQQVQLLSWQPTILHSFRVHAVQSVVEWYIPLATSHTMAVLSTEPVMINLESSDQQRSYMSSIWPLNVSMCVCVCVCADVSNVRVIQRDCSK